MGMRLRFAIQKVQCTAYVPWPVAWRDLLPMPMHTPPMPLCASSERFCRTNDKVTFMCIIILINYYSLVVVALCDILLSLALSRSLIVKFSLFL